jgi:beta-1,4-N-acetylglucosaminyltransferase
VIFVTVGTWQFDSLIMHVDRLVEEGRIREPVIAQIGNGKYQPRHCEFFRLRPSIEPYFREAHLIISCGGATVYEALHWGARLVAVANPDVADNHQSHHLEYLARRGYLLWCRQLDDLESLIHSTTPVHPYEPGTEQLVEDIRQFIEGSPSSYSDVGWARADDPGSHRT